MLDEWRFTVVLLVRHCCVVVIVSALLVRRSGWDGCLHLGTGPTGMTAMREATDVVLNLTSSAYLHELLAERMKWSISGSPFLQHGRSTISIRPGRSMWRRAVDRFRDEVGVAPCCRRHRSRPEVRAGVPSTEVQRSPRRSDTLATWIPAASVPSPCSVRARTWHDCQAKAPLRRIALSSAWRS